MGNLGLVHVALWCALVACALVDKKVYCASCDVEVSEILRTLLNPQENDSLQVQALRRQLLHKLQDMDVADQEYEKIYKGYTSPTKWTEFSDEQKRNLESLARGGTWYKNPPLADDYKRSHYNLLGSPDLPLTTELLANQKRSIEALARNGELNHHQNNQDFRTMLGEFNDKRNVASLAKHFNYPRQTIGKRSISSVAKNGDLPNVYGKRNIQSLARDGLLGKKFTEFVEAPQDKRIHSIKTEQRRKRQADYFSNEAVYQMPVDYEDVLQDLEAAEQNIYPLEDKRFLGSVAKSGWFEPSSRNYKYLPTKRHVAALARLGWLPSYRSSRRFNRSGRSYLKENDTEDSCRETSTDGKTQNYSYTKVSSVPLDSKRFLLQPAVDNILLRKVFRHPRMTF